MKLLPTHYGLRHIAATSLACSLLSAIVSAQYLTIPYTRDSPETGAYDVNKMTWKRVAVAPESIEFQKPIPGTEFTYNVFLGTDVASSSNSYLADATFEGRYLFARANAHVRHLTTQSSSSQATKLMVRFARLYGREYLKNMQQVVAATEKVYEEKYKGDGAAFTADYGTHFVAGRVRAHILNMDATLECGSASDSLQFQLEIGASARFLRAGASFTAAINRARSSSQGRTAFNFVCSGVGKDPESKNKPVPSDPPEMWLDKVAAHFDSCKIDDPDPVKGNEYSARPVFLVLQPWPFLPSIPDDFEAVSIADLYAKYVEIELQLEMARKVAFEKAIPEPQREYRYVCPKDRGAMTDAIPKLEANLERILTYVEKRKKDPNAKLDDLDLVYFPKPQISAKIYTGNDIPHSNVPWIEVTVDGGNFFGFVTRTNWAYGSSSMTPGTPCEFDGLPEIHPYNGKVLAQKDDTGHLKFWHALNRWNLSPAPGTEVVVELLDHKRRVVASTRIQF